MRTKSTYSYIDVKKKDIDQSICLLRTLTKLEIVGPVHWWLYEPVLPSRHYDKVIIEVDGEAVRLPFADIAAARLVPTF